MTSIAQSYGFKAVDFLRGLDCTHFMQVPYRVTGSACDGATEGKNSTRGGGRKKMEERYQQFMHVHACCRVLVCEYVCMGCFTLEKCDT